MAFDYDSGRFTASFNDMPFMALEKDIQAHDLTADEQEQINTLRTDYRDNVQQETDQFNNQDVFLERRQAEFERLLAQHQTPEPALTPPGGPTQPTSDQLLQSAHTNVQLAHEGLIHDYGETYTQGAYEVLDHAAADNRGPDQDHQTQEHAQEQTHDPGQDSGPTQDVDP